MNYFCCYFIDQDCTDINLKNLQVALQQYQRLRIDHKEAACLKALMLFKPNTLNLASYQHCMLIQEQTLALLHKNCSGTIRFGHLLMLLLIIKSAASSQILQDMFFRKTLGEHGLEKALNDTLKS